jgi:hypothetical protein
MEASLLLKVALMGNHSQVAGGACQAADLSSADLSGIQKFTARRYNPEVLTTLKSSDFSSAFSPVPSVCQAFWF